MGSKERREREKHELRQRILDTARCMFIDEGFEAVTMRRLAQRIEYSTTAIYLHFKDKEALFKELCQGDLQAMHQSILAHAQGEDLTTVLHNIAREYVRFALEHQAQFQLIFLMRKPAAFANERLAQPLDEDVAQQAYVAMRQVWVDAMQAGLLKDGVCDADLLAQTWSCGLLGIVALRIAAGPYILPSWQPPEIQATAFVDAILKGVLK